jgi:hypothetical protein
MGQEKSPPDAAAKGDAPRHEITVTRNENGRPRGAAETGDGILPGHQMDRLYGQESQKPWRWLASV